MGDVVPRRTRVGLVSFGLFVLIAWLALFYMRELGRAFGNGRAAPDSVSVIVGFVAIASLGCALYALFKSTPVTRFVALAPIGLVILGEVGVSVAFSVQRSEYMAEEERMAADIAERVAAMPQTYVLTMEFDNDHFIFVDEHSGFLIEVVHGRRTLDAECVGSVIERTLTLDGVFRPRDGEPSYFEEFRSGEGESPFDDFDVVYVPSLNRLLCNADTYRL